MEHLILGDVPADLREEKPVAVATDNLALPQVRGLWQRQMKRLTSHVQVGERKRDLPRIVLRFHPELLIDEDRVLLLQVSGPVDDVREPRPVAVVARSHDGSAAGHGPRLQETPPGRGLDVMLRRGVERVSSYAGSQIMNRGVRSGLHGFLRFQRPGESLGGEVRV